MKHSLVIFFLLFAVSISAFAEQKGKTKQKKQHSKKAKASTVSAPLTPKPVIKVEEERVVVPVSSGETNFRFNTLMGINVFKGSAFVSGFQFGAHLSRHSSLYLGPEVTFSLYDNASFLSALLGGWKEWRLHEPSKLGLAIGAFGGVGFISGLENVKPTELVIYFDTSLSQDIDDLAVIRAHLRPGIIGRNFAFMMNLSVGFRL